MPIEEDTKELQASGPYIGATPKIELGQALPRIK
jgi:hypothetical protein